MRILFFNDLYDPRIGSSVRQMYQLAEHMRGQGHEVAIASTTSKREDVGRAEVEGCEVHRLHSDYPERWRSWVGLSNRRVLPALRELLARWKPDVVHSHIVHTHLSYAALGEARRAGAAVVFTAHDSMAYCYQKLTCFHGGEEHAWALRDYRAYWQKCIPCQRLRYRPGRNQAIARVLARDVDRLTAVSAELRSALEANGIRVDRITGNAIRLRGDLPGPQDVARFRARFGLEGKRAVAIGGRLHDQKGIRQTYAALARLRGEFPDLRLLVMGRADVYRNGFEDAARAAGVHDAVVSTGWLDGRDLDCAYACLDAMLSPSICFETFGLVNLEAMELSKPVVATCFGGVPEVVRDGESGLVVNPFDTEAFAGAIARLLRDPELARRLGQGGRARLERHFTIPRLATEFLEEYEIAQERRRARA